MSPFSVLLSAKYHHRLSTESLSGKTVIFQNNMWTMKKLSRAQFLFLSKYGTCKVQVIVNPKGIQVIQV